MNKIILVTCLCILAIVSSAFSQQDKRREKDTTKNVSFAAIPIINYNRTFGFIAGGMGTMMYKVNKSDTISPSSSSMLIGIYSTSQTYMGLVIQQFYLKEDHWRLTFVGGGGDIAFQYYQSLPWVGSGITNDNGIWIDFNTTVKFIMGSAQYQVLPDFYAGVEIMGSEAITYFDIYHPITGEKLKQQSYMNNLAYTFHYDTRDNVNFPVKGLFLNYKNRFYRDWIGSTEDFQSFELAANHFWDIKENKKSVLVSRIYTNIAAGDVPFQGQNVIGRDDLRGYSQGKYRNDQIYATQVELRQNIYKKFGMIGFLGVGTAVEKMADIPQSELLPSVGLGLRYLMIPKEKMNVGIDVGVGKDDWSLSFRIGETFGR